MDAYRTLAETMQSVSDCRPIPHDDNNPQWPEEPSLYDRYKALEQDYMQLLDQYFEVARALGFSGSGYWGDVLEPHNKIVARANDVYEKAWKYDDLLY